MYIPLQYILYSVGMVVGLTGIGILPARPSMLIQANETQQEAYARTEGEYRAIVVNSTSFKLCMAGCGILVLSVLVHLVRWCREEPEEILPRARRSLVVPARAGAPVIIHELVPQKAPPPPPALPLPVPLHPIKRPQRLALQVLPRGILKKSPTYLS
jgi:hypothetical protein